MERGNQFFTRKVIIDLLREYVLPQNGLPNVKSIGQRLIQRRNSAGYATNTILSITCPVKGQSYTTLLSRTRLNL